MGKFKDKHGHSRWQEGKKDIKSFVDKHGDDIGPIARGILKVAAPRVSDVLETIQEVRKSKAPASVKEKAMSALNQLVDDLDDDEDGSDIGQISYTAATDTGPDRSVDVLKTLNSTGVSKYMSTAILILVAIIFFGMWVTEIAYYWGFSPKQVDPIDKATISAVFGSLIGLRQIIRGEVKKKIVST